MPTIKKPVENPRLFFDDDPLEVDIPGFGLVRLADFQINPPVEDEVSPETKPVAYLVEFIVGAVHADVPEAEVRKVRSALLDGISDNSLTVTWLGELISEITDTYSRAYEAAIAKESGRPTRRRGR